VGLGRAGERQLVQVGEQVVQVERLDQGVLGLDPPGGLGRRGGLGRGGQQDDRGVAHREQVVELGEVLPAGVRELRVQQDGVRLTLPEIHHRIQRPAGARRGDDRVAVLLQRLSDRIQVRCVVLDDQHLPGRAHVRPSPAPLPARTQLTRCVPPLPDTGSGAGG